jgi:hypothetical protein
VRAAWRAGFRRILLVNSHGGNYYSLRSLPQDVLAEDGIPILVTYGDADAPGASGERLSEASGMAGGLRALGRDDLVEEVRRYAEAAVKEFGEDAKPVIYPKPYLDARRLGVVGQDYLDEIRHVQPSTDIDPDAALKRFDEIGAHVAGLLERFREVVRACAPKPATAGEGREATA